MRLKEEFGHMKGTTRMKLKQHISHTEIVITTPEVGEAQQGNQL